MKPGEGCGRDSGEQWGPVCGGEGPYACVYHLEEVSPEAGPAAAGEEALASPALAFEERGVQA